MSLFRKLASLFKVVSDSPVTGPAPLWWTGAIAVATWYATTQGWGPLCQ